MPVRAAFSSVGGSYGAALGTTQCDRAVRTRKPSRNTDGSARSFADLTAARVSWIALSLVRSWPLNSSVLGVQGESCNSARIVMWSTVDRVKRFLLPERMAHLKRSKLLLESLEPRLLLSNTIVRFETSLGDFEVELFNDDAPLTVANFLNYVEDDDYVDSIFHRSVNDFVVQGGGFTWPGFEDVPTDPPVQNEYWTENVRGTISMAKLGGDPDSATSQWFFNLVDNPSLDTQNGGFTVFGQVLGDGMDVIDAIAAVPIYDKSDLGTAFGELPLIDYTPDDAVLRENLVIVDSIEVLEDGGTVVIGYGAAKRVSFRDRDGSLVTVQLTTGNADVTFNGVLLSREEDRAGRIFVAGENLSLADIDMDYTNYTGRLSVSVRGGDGFASVDNIRGNESLHAIDAHKVDLLGDIVIAGSLARLRLHDVAESHEVSIGVSEFAVNGLSVEMNDVTDLAFASSVSVRSMKLRSWTDSDDEADSLDAPGLDRILVREGDLPANVDVGDSGIGKVDIRHGDLTGSLVTSGPVSSIKLGQKRDPNTGAKVGGRVAPDALIEITGMDGVGVSLGRLMLDGAFLGKMTTAGDVSTILLRRDDLAGRMNIAGSLGRLDVRGDIVQGTRVKVAHELTAARVRGSLLGGPGDDGLVQLISAAFGTINVHGGMDRAQILAGTDLGDDWLVGGGDDAFGQGSIERVSVRGDVSDSLIGAGLIAQDGAEAFDLAWLGAEPGRFAGDSYISDLRINGRLTSSSGLGPYGVGSRTFGSIRLGDMQDAELVADEPSA